MAAVHLSRGYTLEVVEVRFPLFTVNSFSLNNCNNTCFINMIDCYYSQLKQSCSF
uniref:Uncharacterized protein n=1 Tax=Anguilla anguilla TaxID=7936 RepID=A0A0E9T2K7_ANGAN